jgi:hypothetical protein
LINVEYFETMIGLRTRAALTIALLLTGLLAADRLTRLAEDGLYGDRIVYARSTPRQRIVVTQKRNELQASSVLCFDQRPIEEDWHAGSDAYSGTIFIQAVHPDCVQPMISATPAV